MRLLLEWESILDDILLGKGTSSTKKKAEQLAAKAAFDKMAK